ncbi:hypothetical protein, partial [Pseudomonas helleri]|uniref:hypothetical protein n=1 Tax=Pseudomonas helleri TaxID=1608996 RepID=UPI001E52E5DA
MSRDLLKIKRSRDKLAPIKHEITHCFLSKKYWCASCTVAKGFTLLYVVTASRADNDSTPIPYGPLSYSGANTPVLATVSASRKY